MLISSLNFKGGQGKSLWAAILAGWLGPKTEVLDLDPQQGDAHSWAEKAGYPTRLIWRDHKAVLQAAAASEVWFVADCPPLESPEVRAAIHFSQLVVVPLIPGGAQDARAWGRLVAALRDARGLNPGMKVAVVINGYRQTALGKDFIEMLKEWHSPKTGQAVLGVVPMRVRLAEQFGAGEVPSDPSVDDVLKKLRAFAQK